MVSTIEHLIAAWVHGVVMRRVEMDDYVPLGPDDEIREGDVSQLLGFSYEFVDRSSRLIGAKVRDYPGLLLKRPRSTLIRDAAIAVLEWYFRDGSVGGAEDPMYELMRSVGVTEEWLRRA
jgi:hypothetical protein